MEKMIQLPLWHFKTIENALRLTNNVCDCHTKETAFDREVTKAYEYAKSALANADTGEGQSNIPDVSVSLLERAASLVGNPGTNISGSTDMACEQWQKDYERWRNER